jgi:hypothetical protein
MLTFGALVLMLVRFITVLYTIVITSAAISIIIICIVIAAAVTIIICLGRRIGFTIAISTTCTAHAAATRGWPHTCVSNVSCTVQCKQTSLY